MQQAHGVVEVVDGQQRSRDDQQRQPQTLTNPASLVSHTQEHAEDELVDDAVAVEVAHPRLGCQQAERGQGQDDEQQAQTLDHDEGQGE